MFLLFGRWNLIAPTCSRGFCKYSPLMMSDDNIESARRSLRAAFQKLSKLGDAHSSSAKRTSHSCFCQRAHFLQHKVTYVTQQVCGPAAVAAASCGYLLSKIPRNKSKKLYTRQEEKKESLERFCTRYKNNITVHFVTVSKKVFSLETKFGS